MSSCSEPNGEAAQHTQMDQARADAVRRAEAAEAQVVALKSCASSHPSGDLDFCGACLDCAGLLVETLERKLDEALAQVAKLREALVTCEKWGRWIAERAADKAKTTTSGNVAHAMPALGACARDVLQRFDAIKVILEATP